MSVEETGVISRNKILATRIDTCVINRLALRSRVMIGVAEPRSLYL